MQVRTLTSSQEPAEPFSPGDRGNQKREISTNESYKTGFLRVRTKAAMRSKILGFSFQTFERNRLENIQGVHRPSSPEEERGSAITSCVLLESG